MASEIPSLWMVGLGAWVVYLIIGGIYRLYFHPLAKFPGPKLAALTGWYEFYHDIIHRGKFIWKLRDLHDQYGPIVRITPNELHIRDSDYYEELYAGGAKKRDKWEGWVTMAGAPESSFATVSHDLHRLRRSALNPFFSKRSIVKITPSIIEKIEHLSERFKGLQKTKEVVRMDAAYMALTMDIITDYAYGSSYDYLSVHDFQLKWKETVIGGSANGVFLRQFPWALPILKATPLSFLEYANPKAAALVSWQHMIRKQVDTIIADHKNGKKATENSVFQAMLDSDLPAQEKSADRLQDEGQTLVGAGSETTAKTLAIITFYLAKDKAKMQKLRDELKTVLPTPTSELNLVQIEQLPYLTAVVNEGIRLMHGVTTRLPRVSQEAMKYNDWVIPPGTPVSQSNLFVHFDAKIFPKPEEYDPERWIRASNEGFRLDRYLVSFSKGSRSCIGIHLAYAELYLTLAAIIRRFEIDNFETTVDDVKVSRDFFVGVPEEGSKGIRAVITGLVEE